MGRHTVALTVCWGWVLLGLLGPVEIAPGAGPTRAMPPTALEQDERVPTPAPVVAEPSGAARASVGTSVQEVAPAPVAAEPSRAAPHPTTEAGASAEPLVPIPAAEGQPAQPLVPIPASESVPPPAPSDFRPPTSALGDPPSELRPPSSPATSAPREVASAPGEFLTCALSLPTDGTIAGRPVRLQELLGRTSDQRQREELIYAYWDLAAAVAECNFCRDLQAQLARWQTRFQGAALPAPTAAHWRAVSAQAQARCEAAQAALVERQHALAALARLAPDEPLPLPADRPYVGVYRTYFRELFPAGAGPGRTRLIDRTLPLGRRAIEHFAAAAQAADEAVAAVDGSELADAAAVSSALSLLKRRYEEQQTLVQAVVDYNRQITEYALAVSPPGVDAGKLVSMLIKSQPEVAQPSSPAAPSPVRPATAEERVNAPGQPTRAVPPPGWTLPRDRLPIGEALPGGSALRASEARPAGSALPPSAATPPRGTAAPTLAPLPTRALPGSEPAEVVCPPGQILPQGPVVPVRPAVEAPGALPGQTPRETPVESPGQLPTEAPEQALDQPPTGPAETPRELPEQPARELPVEPPGQSPTEPLDQSSVQPLDRAPAGPTEARPTEAHPTEAAPTELQPSKAAPSEARPIEATLHKPIVPADTAAVSPRMYGAFEQAPPPQQAEQLSAILHWDRMPPGKGQPMDLPGCLKSARFDDRLAVTEGFWTARGRTAEYQLLQESASWFDDLALVVPAGGTPAEPAVLRMARHHATGAACAAETRLLAAQFDLAVLLGQQNDRLWPLPTTRPHAGAYAVQLDNLAPQGAASWSVRGLAESIARLHGRLVRQATVVVAADQARSLAAAECGSGSGKLAAAVEAVEFQVRATKEFLAAQTDYNTAIARYALAVLPPQTPTERIVEALVVEP